MGSYSATNHDNGWFSEVVPPGFRFHPTEEELLQYYLKKKVAYEAINLDVIRLIDLNKLEPWDIQEKCRIGSSPQNEWYFFSHKDKKYPSGTRTNRATDAGFWKATGRDKVIHSSRLCKGIGMRKTLVFYKGRAPHGKITDWIMHEYRLIDSDTNAGADQWVVCRLFKKKSHHHDPNKLIKWMNKTQMWNSNNHASTSLDSSSSIGTNKNNIEEDLKADHHQYPLERLVEFLLNGEDAQEDRIDSQQIDGFKDAFYSTSSDEMQLFNGVDEMDLWEEFIQPTTSSSD